GQPCHVVLPSQQILGGAFPLSRRIQMRYRSSGSGGLMDYRKLGVVALASAVLIVLAVRHTATIGVDGDRDSVNAGLKSAGVLTFGPDGVLFVGDSMGGAIAALQTGDRTAAPNAGVDVKGIDEKIAALVGIM